MSEWQLIETAPIDEEILLSKYHDDVMFWIASGLIVDENTIVADIHDSELVSTKGAGFWRPTHWMNLPQPPKG